MTQGNSNDTDEKQEKSSLRPAQVAAAALAAVVATFLCSALGVYGTVLGAGLLSLATTIGSEFFLRSLERTRTAARTLSNVRDRLPRRLGGAGPRPGDTGTDDAPTRSLTDAPTVRISKPVGDMPTVRISPSAVPRPGENGQGRGEQAPTAGREQWWRRRWPVVLATSALGFVIGMLLLTGYEGMTGKAISGDGSTTVGNLVRGGGGGTPGIPETPDPQPATEAPTTTEQPTSTSPSRDSETDSTTERPTESPGQEPKQPTDTTRDRTPSPTLTPGQAAPETTRSHGADESPRPGISGRFTLP